MSIRVMTAVWDSTRYDGGELLVLLALADWANDQGRCWPSVPAIARKARLKERQVYNVLRKMRADGVISCEPGGGRGKASVYTINTAMVAGFKAGETLQPAAPKPCNEVQKNPAICNKPLEPHIGRTVKEPLKEPPVKKRAEANIVLAAAQHVCRECTFAGKDMEQIIGAAIAKALEHPECDRDAMQLAVYMAKRWEEYCESADLLRYQWGPAKFFSQGFWRKDSAWPFDQQLLKSRREATVGMRR